MKLKKRKKETHDQSLYPEYYFKWNDFLEVWDSKIKIVTRKKSIEEVLRPYIGKGTKNVHRTFQQRVDRVIEDTIYAYFTTILMEIVKTGKIVKLAGDYGWMTLVVTDHRDKETDKLIPIFMIIQSDKVDKLGVTKKVTRVHIRNIQLYREVIERVEKNRQRYHTIDSFTSYVCDDREQLQILTTI